MSAEAGALAIPDDAARILKDVGAIDRKAYIGGSDIAALLGLDPYGKTPLTVYLAKIGEREGIIDPDKKKFLERRKRWEGPIVQMLREEFDGEIVSVNGRYVDEAHDFLAAEIDFEWRDADGSIQNGEIKTVSPFAFNERAGWGSAGTDEIPIHYHAQVMHGLGVTGRRTCIVCAMAGLDTMVFYRVDRDEEAIAGMRDVAVRFWRENVEARVPPAPLTMGDVMTLYRRFSGKPVELDDDHAQALQDLRAVREEIAALEGDEAELELKVAKFIAEAWSVELVLERSKTRVTATLPPEVDDNATLMHNGAILATWAAGRGAHLDQKKLKTDQPDLVREYTVPHYFRSFRFRKPKS